MNVYGTEFGTFPLVRPVPGPWAYGYYRVENGYIRDASPLALSPEATIHDIYFMGDSGSGLNTSSITANWWLLILRSQASVKQFICKSDPVAAKGPPVVVRDPVSRIYNTDFKYAEQYSYSCAFPYNACMGDYVVDNGAGMQGWGGPPPGGWWKNTGDGALPIMSDIAPMNGTGSNPVINTVQAAPGPANPKQWNSNNHQRVGQNVAFADAHVEFGRRPDVGQNGDNIWTHNNHGGAARFGGYAVDTSMPYGGQLTDDYGSDAPPYDIVMVPVRSLDDGSTK